jgi:hypothetical protein
MKLPRWIGVFVLLAALWVPAGRSQAFRYTFTGSFYTSAFPTAVQVGDSFSLAFTLDAAATDALADTSQGSFTGAISNLAFNLTGGTGSYPGGTMSGSQFLQVVDNTVGGDLIAFTLSPAFSGTGAAFPDPAGNAWSQFTFSLQSNSPSYLSFNTASGESLTTLLGGRTINLGDFVSADATVSLLASSGTQLARAYITGISVSAIPEPSTYAACLGLAALVGAARVRRSRISRGI